jgi:hypothetical protein
MFTKLFWIDALERGLKTVAQTLVTLFLASGEVFNLLVVDWKQALGVASGAGVLSLLMSVGSAAKAGTDTASLVVDTKKLTKEK